MWNGDIKSYTAGYVYIVDDVDSNAQTKLVKGKAKLLPHAYNCDLVRDFFNDHTDYEVVSVRFPPGTKEPAFFKYWDEQLSNKTDEDLLIVYFHGHAGNEEEEYSWTFEGYPKRGVDAYELIKKFTNCPADSIFLLDCWIHTRITEKWENKPGNTEIIACGIGLQDAYGRAKEARLTFTEAFAQNVGGWADRLWNGGHTKSTKLRSIPHIMAKDKNMHSNPQRIWLDQTRAGKEEFVGRFMMDPNDIRDNETLQFYLKQIQGKCRDKETEGDKPEGDEADASGDEGVSDMNGPPTPPSSENEDSDETLFVEHDTPQ